MAQTQDNSLEARIRDLEAFQRASVTRNPLDRASVVNASGEHVELSALAFGQALSIKPGVGAVSIKGTLNASTPNLIWVYDDPYVEVLVTGGRLRVDWGSLLAVEGLGTRAVMSYAIVYRGPPESRGSVWTTVVGADYYRALILQTPSGAGTIGAFGTFSFHTGLVPGWYRLASAYALLHGVDSTLLPACSFDNPRIGATPY